MSKNSCPALLYYMTEGWRLLRWGLGVVPAITYHCNAVPVVEVEKRKTAIYCDTHLVLRFLKSAWRHGVIDFYDKARNTPYFAPWHFGDRLGVYRWPQCKYKTGFYKSHSRLSKITAGNRCRNIWTMQNVTNRSLRDSNKLRTWS